MRHLLILTATLGMMSLAMAQITITSANIPDYGTIFEENESNDIVSFTPGPGGPNQTWNLNAFEFSENTPTEFIHPAGSPFEEEFLGATLVSESGTNYSYYLVDQNGVYLLGMGDNESQTLIEMDYQTLVAAFPMTYNTSWSTVFAFTTEPVPGIIVQAVDSSVHNIDSWGTLITPDGSFPVLRDQQTVYIWTVLNGEIMDEQQDFRYSWYGQDGFSGATFLADGQAPDPNFTDGFIGYTRSTASNSEEIRGPVANSFSLSQNYPNPFNPSTHLPISLNQSGNVSLKIYNETGQLVSEKNYSFGPGQHELPIDGSKWSTGTYFANVSANGQNLTQKMQLLK